MSSPEVKGQVFSMDLLLAVVIFIIVVGILMATWNFNKNRMDEAAWSGSLEDIAYTTSDSLVMTPGSPSNWEENTSGVVSLGLSRVERNIDERKIDSIVSIDVVVLRNLTHAGVNNISITLLDASGNVLKKAGVDPVGEYFVSSSRVVIYNGEMAVLKVMVGGDKNTAGVLT